MMLFHNSEATRGITHTHPEEAQDSEDNGGKWCTRSRCGVVGPVGPERVNACDCKQQETEMLSQDSTHL